MGQRHQIYIRLPFKFHQKKDWGTDDTVLHHTIALHHQWLYGFLPLRQLIQFYDFYQKGTQQEYFVFGEQNNFQPPERAAQGLYSFHFETGDYYPTLIEPHPVARDPRMGDNNDGITVIDLRDKDNFKYCFMHLDDLKPITADEYLRRYYSDYELNEHYEHVDEACKKLKNIQVLTFDEVRKMFPDMYMKEIFEQ